MHTNVQSVIPVNGDAKTILNQIEKALPKEFLCNSDSEWWKEIRKQEEKNKSESSEYINDPSIPMNYYNSLSIVQKAVSKLGDKFFLVSEGSNTLNIGRTILMNT